MVNPNGGVLLEYVGGSAGDMTWFGASGKRYRAGGVTRVFPVDKGDVATLLGLAEGHQTIFRRYQEHRPEPAPVNPPKLEPEPKPEPKPKPEPPKLKPLPIPDPALLTVAEIRAAVETEGTETLGAMLEAERDGKNRKTAIKVLENAVSA